MNQTSKFKIVGYVSTTFGFVFLIAALLGTYGYGSPSDVFPLMVLGLGAIACGVTLLSAHYGEKRKIASSTIGNEFSPQQVALQSDASAPPAQEQEMPIQPLVQEKEKSIPNQPRWMSQWKEVKNLKIPLENDHFFLERRYLDDFSKELISHANSSVLIANPYIQPCDLSDLLRIANRNGVNVQIITRHPTGKTPEYREKMNDYHLMLISEGISITYDDRAHAKLIIADNAIAVVSSMNFFANSSAGASWEAGLVTMNPHVVESIAESFSKACSNNV